ncbi:hypothetical protein BDW02DRAFT_522733 [Decorospora gaudefroyi]|uniref:Uncharacterized protein n=1 Tax=Decorospora gaudefroyi TaxID=184978 RepID=A0A6A5KMP8_9PLEO|nr:hypothetical protein BDW02DRAFT_522733 [Decorospora gaudefroyi]
MVAWITVLTCLVTCLLGSTCAAPLDQAGIQLPPNNGSLEQLSVRLFFNNTSVAEPNPVNAATKYENSLQIILLKNTMKNTYYFVFWQGPSNTAVHLCGDKRFKRVAEAGPFYFTEDRISNPPFPPPLETPIKYSNWKDCWYRAARNPGTFSCGTSKINECALDPRYKEPVIDCGHVIDRRFRRVSYCEF